MPNSETKTTSNLTVHFLVAVETKGAYRYEEVASAEATEPLRKAGKPYVTGSLYLRKEVFAEGQRPERLVVTIAS